MIVLILISILLIIGTVCFVNNGASIVKYIVKYTLGVLLLITGSFGCIMCIIIGPLEVLIFFIPFILLGRYLIFKDYKKYRQISINNNTNINNISSTEGIIFPIHIKYKSILDQTAYTVYNCFLDGKIVATLSSEQEVELDVTQGEHIIFFATANRAYFKD